MKNLLIKEMKLFTCPMNFIFLAFVAMLFIPSYPYYVYFFYILLGIFFSFLFARENKDMVYMTTLPIPKKDIVKGKYLFLYSMELMAVLLGVVVVVLRCTVAQYENRAGIDANVAMLGINFILMAIFNIVFLDTYFKKPEKVGLAFVKANIAYWILMIAAEASVFISRGISGSCFWDSTDGGDLIKQIPILIIGVVIYIMFGVLSYHRDVKNFDSINII